MSISRDIWAQRRSGKKPQRADDYRDPYERDRCRVVHSAAFRRLQRKTQVLGVHESDFHRTRLTHSIEVSSIARNIAAQLIRGKKLSDSLKEQLQLTHFDDYSQLVTTISLLHDVGHPPFGHAGEYVLDYIMHEQGGFEGNGQTLRLLTHLENYSEHNSYGLDLTRRTLLGLIKYPCAYSTLYRKQKIALPASAPWFTLPQDWKPPKAYLDTEQEVVDWILSPLNDNDRRLFQTYEEKPKQHANTLYKSFDCSIMDLADDIAYGVHDLEDMIVLGLIQRETLASYQRRKVADTVESLFNELFPKQGLLDALFGKDSYYRKQAIGELVNLFITKATLHENPAFSEPVLRYNVKLQGKEYALLQSLKRFVLSSIVDTHQASTIRHGGQIILQHLFAAFNAQPQKLLDDNDQKKLDILPKERVVCDYIAGMTDEYARRMYERLYGLGSRTMFEKI